MAQPGGTGSTLGNITAKAEQLRKIRTRLGMDQTGRTQTNLQPAAPTNPAAGKGPDFDVEGAIQTAAGSNRGRLLDMIKRSMPALGQQEPGGQTLAGPTEAAPSPKVQSPFDHLQPETRPLVERLQEIGAASVSPVEQFARIAGRMPSPRELTIFNARFTLEGQLGRPPTPTELKLYIMRPEEQDSAFPSAFEA